MTIRKLLQTNVKRPSSGLMLISLLRRKNMTTSRRKWRVYVIPSSLSCMQLLVVELAVCLVVCPAVCLEVCQVVCQEVQPQVEAADLPLKKLTNLTTASKILVSNHSLLVTLLIKPN